MRVEPDADEARTERAAAATMLSSVLDRVRSEFVDATAHVDVCPQALLYPGVFAVAYEAQAARRAQPLSQDASDRIARGLQDAVRRAGDSRIRATDSDCSAWCVDLAVPEEHLRASLGRAVSQVPQRPDRIEALAAIRVGEWSDADRAAFCDAACLLEATWPQMLAEVDVVVQQIALLHGFGIDGFTDVATHGAIYVNRARLGTDDAGLPGPTRMAEAIVHEAAHNRCNAAALSDRFLADPKSGAEPVVMTPLRQDARPLTGLLQQLVVLVRSVLLYDRLLDSPDVAPAAIARREKLRGQASEALRVIGGHTGHLTDHGRAVVEEAGDLFTRSAALAGN